MNNVKVSVVVPVYNVENYIDECLRSLLNQTLDNIEIILVDDGSTDNSGKICDDYEQKYEKVRVVRKVNGGLGSARNAGLAEAVGQYVYFIDSDDSLKYNALETLYNKAVQSELDVLMFSAECFSDGIGINYNANEYKRTKYLNEVMSGKELFLKLWDCREYYASIPLRLYKTSYLQSKDYVFPEHIIHEDEVYAYWSLIQAEHAECISDRFYNRRFRAGSIMTSKRAYNSAVGYVYTWKKIVDTMGELKDWSDEELDQVVSFAYSRVSVALDNYAMLFDSSDIKRFRSEIKGIKESLGNNARVRNSSRRLRLVSTNPLAFRCYIRICNYKDNRNKALAAKKEKAEFEHTLSQIEATKNSVGTRAILIGTPTHGNLGDQAIVLSEYKMLQQISSISEVIEVHSKDYLQYSERLQGVISEKDIIIIDGGGSMGTLWVNNEYRFRDVISRFPNNRIYIFPQTVFYGDNEWEQKVLEDSKTVFSQHKKLTIFCRELLSFDFVRETFTENKVLYTPDMVLALYPQKMDSVREDKVLLCLREDVEAEISEDTRSKIAEQVKRLGYKIDMTSTLIGGNVDSSERETVLNEKWREFAQASLVVTDRLHAMIFCALTGTPCIALNNRSGKVEGVYDWLKELSYISILKTPYEIDVNDLKEIISKADKYEELGRVKSAFEEMRQIIEENERSNS